MTLEFDAARENMVENQVRTNDVTDLQIQDAMRVVRREQVCPKTRHHLAYAETQVEYAPGLYLLQPRDVAKLLQAVRPRAGERALAIAAPYAALVLAEMGLQVRLRLPEGEALDGVAAAVAERGCAVVRAALDAPDTDGPYNVILVEGAVATAPPAWPAMLHHGGRLGVIERKGPVGHARLYLRGDDGVISSRVLFDAQPTYLPGFEPVAAFQF